MIAEGRVFPWQVEYNALPWKYTAGTPNVLTPSMRSTMPSRPWRRWPADRRVPAAPIPVSLAGSPSGALAGPGGIGTTTLDPRGERCGQSSFAPIA